MLLIKGVHTVGNLSECDILIKEGVIAEIARQISPPIGSTIVDAKELVAAPGLVDMHVHFRDPGLKHKEDILTGAAAAAAGGVTLCACMPNTNPVIDNVQVINYVLDKAKQALVSVVPFGAVTVGQKGSELTDFKALKDAGICALSDDGNPIQSAAVMRKALALAREHNILISSHCEDAEMVQNYAVNEGVISRQLGLPGRPAIAEELMVARDAMLAAESDTRIHIAHVSTAGTVEIIRRAKDAGIKITAETCPHYFSLTDEAIIKRGTLARVNPPLRTQKDAEAIIHALSDGTIDVIATDHAPHSVADKDCSLSDAMSGMIGLETSLALTLTNLYHKGHLKIEHIINLMAVNPRKILGLEPCTLTVGSPADIVLFDPDATWTVKPEHFYSKARNTPFGGEQLRGKVIYTIKNGRIVYSSESNSKIRKGMV